jgi:curli biogenesis system outer membrane secretion channel CsgG
MPKKLEKALKAEARKKGLKGADAYVFGTLRKWKPKKGKK